MELAHGSLVIICINTCAHRPYFSDENGISKRPNRTFPRNLLKRIAPISLLQLYFRDLRLCLVTT